MFYEIIPVTAFEQNCTLIWCGETNRAAVVDPGGDLERILASVRRRGVTPERILITHGHVDHAAGAAELKDKLGLPIEGPHVADKYWLDGMAQQGRMFGFGPARGFTPDRWLAGGDTVTVGNLVLEVRHCPGHTPGHVIFFEPQTRVAVVGDVLFAGSIGRTDFPGGDHDTLLASIVEQLWPLGDDVTFLPGHGPVSTFGRERRSNPFVADRVLGR